MGQDSVLAEQSLAARIRHGDSAAEVEFVERFYWRVLVVAQVRTGDRQVALDLAQTAMIGVLQALRDGSVDDHQHVAGYVRETARSLIDNHFRARGRADTGGVVFDGQIASGDPEMRVAERERLELVGRALDQMRPDDHEILRMMLVEGLTSDEIANRLDLEPDLVRKRKSRAVSRLRKAVNQVSRFRRASHGDGEGAVMDCAGITDELVMERYLRGEIDDSGQEAFEQHFFDCDECFARLEALHAAHQVLAAEPISRAFQIGRPPPLRTWGWAVAAAAVVVVGVVAVLWTVMRPALPRIVPLSPVHQELARVDPPSYEPALLRGPEDEAQKRFRAAMEFYTVGDYVSAIEGLEEAAALDSDVPNISYYLGASYLLAGRDPEGIAELEHTVELGETPFLEEALLLLAKGRIRQRDLDGARAALERAVALGGDVQQEASAWLRRLSEAAIIR